jgi:NAD(P)-dependent dehydrogenase (short-subunit alcohol dehydrogenase family)
MPHRSLPLWISTVNEAQSSFALDPIGMSTKVYLITGANRGLGLSHCLFLSLIFNPKHKPSLYFLNVLGLGLVETFASKHANIAIFALARNPSKSTELLALQAKFPGKIFPVAYDATDKQSAKAAARVVEEKYGWVDVVVANAGQSSFSAHYYWRCF